MEVDIRVVVAFLALCALIFFGLIRPDWQHGDWSGLVISLIVLIIALLTLVFGGGSDDDVTPV